MASENNFGKMNFALKNGLNMPAVGLGTLGIKNYEVLYKTIDHALEYGYRLFDTAGVHGHEKQLRNAFRQLLPKHGLVREDVFVTTKLTPFTSDGSLVLSAFDRSLDNLDMEYVDMYMIDFNVGLDPNNPTNTKSRNEIWLAITKLYDQCKIKALGVSNFNLRHLMQLTEVMAVGPMINQIEWNPYCYKPEMLQYCADNNIRIQAYSTFGGLTRNNIELIQDPVIKDIAKKYEASVHQVLLMWSLQRGVAVMPKSVDPAHLKENIDLNFKISDNDLVKMDNLSSKCRLYSWDPTEIA